MKKIFFSIMAVAALAACTKSEVAYDAPAEIGFAPAAGNVTKATGMSGALATTQELGIWAFWDKDGAVEEDVKLYTAYDDAYLANALFANKGTAWGGSPTGYPWPINGALVFAGYTTPGDDVLTNGTAVSYDYTNDIMTFTEYDNTNEFDLCWFGRTANSYNYRASGTAVPVELSHALTWISVQVKGEGAPVGSWQITSMSLANVVTKGTATCTGETSKATWTSTTTATSYPIYSEDAHPITGEAVKLTDNVIIPSLPLELTVNYQFTVQGVTKTDSKTVSLKLNEGNTQAWESGVHYTYTLLFKGNEILVAPTYGNWGEADQSVTVE